MKHNIVHEEIVNGIIYKTIEDKDIDRAVDFYFDVFLKDEPSTVSFGGYSQRNPAMDQQMREAIQDGVSVMAVDPVNQNKLVGFRTAFTVSRGEDMPSSSLEENLKIFPRTHACIMQLFEQLMSPADILRDYPDVNKIYDMFTLACHPDYRGRGIATELVRQALKVAKKANCDCAIVLSTNNFTRRIFEKLGMTTLRKTEWEDCKIEGKPIFGRVESEYATSHFFRL